MVGPGEVEAALAAMLRAKVEARDLCKAFAKQATGWEVGDRIACDRGRYRGLLVEVVGFAGIHPQTWAVTPIVLTQVVRRDGKAGARPVRLEIDTDGLWERLYRRTP